ncbi:hypothetical protein A2765_00305 [Candidatus Kaiserbacteria bacterium RIFCSPHIGHO2_01_FULL_56_24]|uniref:Uncharacterized protein n=1 Tax=Candidatus Kaiserbacteria bacterium RIFCSPHIGHO2_01_FULL_56_24 TaxID=1798487 RepID=A0A1F6DFL7_9BACT|nr:MAG: hypothetical protein A2765_00305 [Candidatus Kaiserbacteria bacterium RIFCSPHIGHO2_01_FULL_56_24]
MAVEPGQESRAHLDIHLNELRIVMEQMHVRMRRIDRLIMQGTILFSAVFGVVATHASWLLQRKTFFPLLLIPIPFYVIVLLQVREDVIRLSREEYYYRLRLRILTLVNKLQDMDMLHFMAFTSAMKRGGWATFFSSVRYAFPGLAFIASFVAFLLLKGNSETKWEWYEYVLFMENVVVGPMVFIGGYARCRSSQARMKAALKESEVKN